MTEDKFQAICFQWAWNQHPLTRRCLWAVPNGGYRDAREGAKFKATGVLAGVHDLHMLWDSQFYTIELKVWPNGMSFDQVKFATIITAQGGRWFEVCWRREGDEEIFKNIFRNILLGQYKIKK